MKCIYTCISRYVLSNINLLSNSIEQSVHIQLLIINLTNTSKSQRPIMGKKFLSHVNQKVESAHNAHKSMKIN